MLEYFGFYDFSTSSGSPEPEADECESQHDVPHARTAAPLYKNVPIESVSWAWEISGSHPA